MPLTIPGDLMNSFRTSRVHLFVGSGISAAAGMQTWDALIDEMKQVIRDENNNFPAQELEDFLNSADHLDIAEVFRDTVKEHRYYSLLRQKYRQSGRLSPLHHVLSKLPVKTIFTTNYDKLFEFALRQHTGTEPSVIIYPQQLGYIDDTELRVIKLHGDIDHPSTIVLTRSDYATYVNRHAEIVRELHRSINNYTMLFLGFGLRDTNFRRIYDDARSLYDSGHRQAYAIMVDTNSVERGVWDGHGLKIIPANSHGQILTYTRQILNSI
jgi:NAD-dependent SIR2 family protein deacetylase